jgi:HlyD family secretion protein
LLYNYSVNHFSKRSNEMDIQRPLQAKTWWRKYWIIFPILIATSIGVWAKRSIGDASYMIMADKIKTAKVEQGDFVVNIRGTGQLKPNDIRWIASQVSGRVEQILVKPGALVENNQILAILSNPELLRQVERAQWELDAKTAESAADTVSMQSQLLDMQTTASAAEYDYKSSKLRYDAETVLINQGNNTVSKLDYQRSQFSYQQQYANWQSQLKRIDMMHRKIESSQIAQQARLGLLKSSLQQLQDQVKQLHLRATTQGILQQMSLELGQQTNVGSSVALIAKQDNLIAEVQIQELQISDIRIGQPAIVDTRNSKIQGEVIRINPAVEAGMVQVEIKLIDALPEEARPDLNIEALIKVTHIEDALYVKRPYFAPRFGQAQLFKLDDSQLARRTDVTFGNHSVHQIQIVAGLKAGDRIIISDTTAWQQHAEVFMH